MHELPNHLIVMVIVIVIVIVIVMTMIIIIPFRIMKSLIFLPKGMDESLIANHINEGIYLDFNDDDNDDNDNDDNDNDDIFG